MGQPWDWYTNISEIAYNKSSNPNPNTDTYPPQVVNGALFQGPVDDTRFYLYGGTTSYWNESFPGWQPPTSQQYVLWSYDTNSTQWDQYDISAASVWRPSNGFRAEAPDQGLAFYLNGEIDSGSSQTTQVLGNYVKIFLEGMIVVNTTAQTATNISTEGFSEDYPRTRGGMVCIPGNGEHGILVAIGGTYKAVSELDASEEDNWVSMSEVSVFDIGAYYSSINGSNSTKSGWYGQNVTGDIPPPRAAFCVVAISPPDSSSHSIYLSAGQGPSDTYYDDVYVLSLPSFTWTQVYGPAQSPHYGHTCHVVGRQLIAVGGALGRGWGPPCNWRTKGVDVLDLSKIVWGSKYSPSLTNYTVPDKVLATIGGMNGTAAMTQPVGGFGDPGLARLFGVYESPTNAKPKKRNIGAIAGGSTAGGVIAAILIGAVVYFVRFHK